MKRKLKEGKGGVQKDKTPAAQAFSDPDWLTGHHLCSVCHSLGMYCHLLLGLELISICTSLLPKCWKPWLRNEGLSLKIAVMWVFFHPLDLGNRDTG